MKIVLADLQLPVVTAWQKAFAGVADVEIRHGSIFDVPVDALVSPANSFGFMDGGLDLQISKFFGWHIQSRLQEVIKERHSGELLVATSVIIETDFPEIPYVIASPTMRVPMILGKETVNVYLAVRAALLRIECLMFPNIESVSFPGMGTGVGRVPPDICARQMRQAFDDVYVGSSFPQTWKEAQERHQLLYSDRYRDLQKS